MRIGVSQAMSGYDLGMGTRLGKKATGKSERMTPELLLFKFLKRFICIYLIAFSKLVHLSSTLLTR